MATENKVTRKIVERIIIVIRVLLLTPKREDQYLHNTIALVEQKKLELLVTVFKSKLFNPYIHTKQMLLSPLKKLRMLRSAVRSLVIITLLFSSSTLTSVNATHVVGGDLGYRYLGETAPGTDQFRYELILRFYFNCGPGSSYPSIADLVGENNDPLKVGVYLDDPTDPDSDKVPLTVANVYLVNYSVISPALPDGCTLGEGQCVEESRLVGTVTLPGSATGHHLYFHHFARNESINNLADPGGTGIGFYSFIPPTAIANSSPVFIGTPVTFICVNDTTTFNNTATDADGDSLVFSFEIPYASAFFNGGNIEPPSPLYWPIGDVQYAPTYSVTEPFGPNGFASIDPVTGVTKYVATSIGNWVVAIEVKEYRNGQLIGRIRSDLQLLSTVCTGNASPAPVSGQFQNAYQINAGEELCFTVPFSDLESDSLGFSVNGQIFDSTIFPNAANITDSIAPNGDLFLNFCWTTVCDQGNPNPYYFSILVYDDACPPGFYSNTVSVEVVPSASPLTISGAGINCAGQSTAVYCTQGINGATYNWSANGGVITTNPADTCVTVNWDLAGVGEVIVTRTFDDCTISTAQPINILASPPVAFELGGDTTCSGIRLSATDISPGSTSSTWTVNGTTLATQDTQISLPIDFNGTGTIGLTMTNDIGCTAYTEQVINVGSYLDLIHFRMPNVFSPNGDGVNDRLEMITGQALSDCFEIQIFDRWGKEVYTGNGGGLGWNGRTNNGEDVGEGAYYYVISIDEEKVSGHVTLLR